MTYTARVFFEGKEFFIYSPKANESESDCFCFFCGRALLPMNPGPFSFNKILSDDEQKDKFSAQLTKANLSFATRDFYKEENPCQYCQGIDH